MTIVLVHGNPETSAIWEDLIPHLEADAVKAISPPGFGAPVPEGFSATSDAYLEWLSEELSAMDSPVDLIGHDWGGGHVMRLACQRPELIRSWTCDILGIFTPEYVWHDAARVWQTEGAGEAAVAQMVASDPVQMAAGFERLGMTASVARQVAAAVDEEMGRCILKLYRSAAQPVVGELFGSLEKASARPGLALVATEDHYTGGEELARKAAVQAGARVAVLENQGHWWMCSDPCGSAAVINEFLASLDAA